MPVALFDFDGTITKKDTFFPFLITAFGRGKVYRALLEMAAGLPICGWRSSLRNCAKQELVRRLFAGGACDRLEEIADRYAVVVRKTFRESAVRRIQWHREQGHRCILVSASLDVYLLPIASHLKFDDLLCTRVERERGVFNGQLIGENCRGQEKVRRIADILGRLDDHYIYAYGDSAGDREMLAIADEKYYRPFRDA